MNKPNPIAALGQNIQFVAFFAHFGCAAYITHLFPGTDSRVWMALAFSVAAAAKEFWFDAKYEAYPPQTMLDNTTDFVGWVLGAWVGVI